MHQGTLQRIVFEYDPLRSKQNRQFTIRLSCRIREQLRWVKRGPSTGYRASDLPQIRPKVADDLLFRMVLESEMEFRRAEARFLSPNADFTILRVALQDLRKFISECDKQQILCDSNGTPLRFEFEQELKLKISASKVGEHFHLKTYITDVETSKLDYIIRAKHVTGVLGKRILALQQNILFSFLESLPSKLDSAAFDSIKQTLSKYGSGIQLKIQGQESMRVLRNSNCQPRLNIAKSFTTADLSFLYPTGITVSAEDSDEIIHDFQIGIELHRNIDKETAYISVLQKSGAKYRKHAVGNWYLPTGKLDHLLEHLVNNDFSLQVNDKPLRLDVHHTWHTDTGNQQIRLSVNITAGDSQADFGTLLKAFTQKKRFLRLSDDSLGYISTRLMAEFSKFISISRANFNKEQIIFRGHDFPLVSELLDSAGDCEIDSEYRKLVEFGKGFFDFGSCPIPDTLKGSLRPYQQKGFNWLIALNQTRFNGILVATKY